MHKHLITVHNNNITLICSMSMTMHMYIKAGPKAGQKLVKSWRPLAYLRVIAVQPTDSGRSKDRNLRLLRCVHADCPDTLRSTCAYVFYLAGSPISWHTKLHTVLTTSTNHSEYCAAAKAAREAKWWDKLTTETGFGRFVRPIDLFSDSKGAIAMTYNPVQRAASKHVDLADHYAREQQEHGTITISYVPTKDMIADTLTKPLAFADLDRHAKKLVQPVTL